MLDGQQAIYDIGMRDIGMRDVTAVQAFMRYKKKKKSAELRGRRWS
jgi:hypothetical protein